MEHPDLSTPLSALHCVTLNGICRMSFSCSAHGCMYSPLLGVWLHTQDSVRQERVGIYSLWCELLHGNSLCACTNPVFLEEQTSSAGYSCVHRLFLWVTCHTVNPHPSEPCSDLCVQTSPTQADLMTRHLRVWRKVLNVLSDNTVLRDRTTLCLYNHPLLPTVQRCCPVIKHVKNYFGLSQPVFNKLFWHSSICIFFHKEWLKGQKYLRCQNWNNFSVNGAALPTVCNPVFSSEPFLNPTKPVSVWIDLPLCYKVIWMKSY